MCAGPSVAGDGGVDGHADVAIPPGCDDKAEPKDSPACVVSEFGVFVSSAGKPDAAGTKEDPVNSIGIGLSKLNGKPRIYVCGGTYNERVVLPSAVSIYGGFNCDGWAHTGAKPVVGTPSQPGYALDVSNVNGAFEIADLEFVAANGNESFINSIAARFVQVPNATLRRVSLKAGDGANGEEGLEGASGETVKHTDPGGSPIDPKGNPGSTPTKQCRCPNAPTASTSGGSGGGFNGPGQPGGPDSILPSGPGGVDNGGGGSAGCSTGKRGATPKPAAAGAVSVQYGALDDGTWVPARGGDGSVGIPGQGGGGGGGTADGQGGGGGCGGCGGFGGEGGGGGGASVVLLAIDSPVRLVATELSAARGGDGGAGGAGGPGGPGGTGGAGTELACAGGAGGSGGAGGGGAGGPGGLSVGVLYRGAPPIDEGATITPSTPGNGGAGKSGNDGPTGLKAPIANIDSAKPNDGGS